MVGGPEAWLIVDDTALPKKGERSVGVAPQYASALDKNANCQTLVSLTLASGEVPVMVGLRLFLPESWTSDAARLTRAGVPEAHWVYRTKPEIALGEIDRAHTAGLRFGCVLADAGYGLSATFRQGLSERGLTWDVDVGARQKVYPVDVALVFAAIRIKVADGPPQRMGDMGQQYLPGEEAWLIGEHRSNGERKYYLSILPADTSLKRLAGAIKARWICEQAHQQLKE